ncbi:MAG: hypothetical protein K6T75_08140 [Acetobacteraceae bacterium]|nr:hypothetical protein [Acetobacteraceae bacterium]
MKGRRKGVGGRPPRARRLRMAAWALGAAALAAALVLAGTMWRVWVLEVKALTDPPRTAYVRLGQDRQFAVGWQVPGLLGGNRRSQVALLEVDAAGRFAPVGSEAPAGGPEVTPDLVMLKPEAGGPEGFTLIAPEGTVELKGWAMGEDIELRARRAPVMTLWGRPELTDVVRRPSAPLRPRQGG